MGHLIGFHVQAALQHFVQRRGINGEVFTVVAEGPLAGPELQHNIQHFRRLFPHRFPLFGIQAEERQISGDGAVANPPVEPTARQMVQHGDAVGQFHGVVDGQEGNTGGEFHLLRQRRCLGNEQVRTGGVLPPLGEVLTNPGFVETQAIGFHQQGEIPIIGVGIGTIGGMQGHHEQAKLHGALLRLWRLMLRGRQGLWR
jgi:hypothetical protein